ncbi:uncharacterized protein BP5553_07113 [Venustampulla echinocandica]|uniref:Heterokaryon incompatibility domain-containing protein n=1 Tax=Venustampulla echinocandica TaxID=2656787 RepID=A0A370TIJ8_9HELO|nr:uncharacterized protein BP5553_07113 [Venustampulla echinocandica]RDL35182.1 hypothetical protein BP5553_07113 [Venustampulla echinocandica]
MPLCATCDGVDVRNLLRICLSQCRDKQEALSDGETYDNRLNYEGSEVKHHDDIFEIEKSSQDCGLCKVIFQAFKRTNVHDVEIARGLQIIFRASYNKIEIMEKDPASKRSIEIASRWLKNCVESHSSCRPPTELQKPPKRLIHVGNKTQNLFLVETFPDLQHVEWLSLSYRWREEPSKKLTGDTMNELKNGIPLTDFDDTIQDAVSVTRDLGISYIWIDALCIIQGSNDSTGEWNEEASKMNEIYGGSIVTLVIASSASVKNGFLTERDLNYIPVAYSTNLTEDRKAKLFLSPEWDDSEREYNGVWTSQIIWKCCEEQRFERGVTERVEDIISETLTYSDHDDISFGSGLFWQLPAFLKFKGFKKYLPISLDYPLMSHSDTFRLWYDLVEDYTQRRFENISDRLVAISGIARIYGDMIRNPTYVAGLWKEDLIRGLLWHVEGTMLIPKRPTDDIPTFHKAFPSWSWTSVGYEVVKNDLKTDNSIRALSEIENIQIDLVDQDPFGAIKRGSITITGPLRRLPRLYNKEWASAEASMSELERHISEIVEEESQGPVAHEYSSSPEGHFSVLLMLENMKSLHLLVLEATSKINVYRRGGILELCYVDPSGYTSPEVIATLTKMETSIPAQLGPHKKARTMRKTANAAFMEIKRENWVKETVMIV